MKNSFIAIEGNIGSGKTTLAKLLAENLNGRLLLEEFEENPFLKGFYKNPQRYAFSVEMSFLADRYQQMSDKLDQSNLFEPLLISDYSPQKSLLFAQNNLPEKEFKLYRKFWQMTLGKFQSPDLLIFLHRPINSLKKNIRRRGRQYEQGIEESYLKDLSLKYQSMLRQQSSTHIMAINADEYDFINNPEDVNKVSNQLIIKLNSL